MPDFKRRFRAKTLRQFFCFHRYKVSHHPDCLRKDQDEHLGVTTWDYCPINMEKRPSRENIPVYVDGEVQYHPKMITHIEIGNPVIHPCPKCGAEVRG